MVIEIFCMGSSSADINDSGPSLLVADTSQALK